MQMWMPIQAGGEQKEVDTKRAKAGLKKQVLALVKKAEGIGDTPDEEVIFDKIQQSIADKLSPSLKMYKMMNLKN